VVTKQTPEHDEDLIRARYGRVKRANPRLLSVVATVVGVIGLGLLIWIGLGLTQAQATPKVISFNVADPGLTTVEFQVNKPTDATAECTVEALSTGFAQVGVKTVTIGPSETETVIVVEEVKTSEVATTAVVDDCRIVD